MKSDSEAAARERESAGDMFAHAPWRWREEWASGYVRGEHNLQVLDRWFIAMGAVVAFAVANVFVLPTAEDRATVAGGLLLGVLLLLCGVLVAWAIRGMQFDYALGTSVFRFPSGVGVPGCELKGTIEVPTHLDLREDAMLTLACLKEDRTGERVLHLVPSSEEIRPTRKAGAPQCSEIAATFPIPRQGPETTPDGADPIVRWVAILASKPDRRALRIEFELPVMRVSRLRPDAQTSSSQPGTCQEGRGAGGSGDRGSVK